MWGISFGNSSTGRAVDSPYMALYNASHWAIKAVSPRLSVGGPATAKLKNLADFTAACDAWGVPVTSTDFVSTHYCERAMMLLLALECATDCCACSAAVAISPFSYVRCLLHIAGSLTCWLAALYRPNGWMHRGKREQPGLLYRQHHCGAAPGQPERIPPNRVQLRPLPALRWRCLRSGVSASHSQRPAYARYIRAQLVDLQRYFRGEALACAGGRTVWRRLSDADRAWSTDADLPRLSDAEGRG